MFNVANSKPSSWRCQFFVLLQGFELGPGLAAVILHVQCCKFKTKQLTLPVLCFITRLRTRARISCGDPSCSMLQIQNQAAGAACSLFYFKASNRDQD